MIKRILKLFSRRKKKYIVPPKPDWQETVRLMREHSLDCFADKVVKVIFSTDGEHRFILFESKEQYFYYIVQYLSEFDDEEWLYIFNQPDALPAMWISPCGTSQRSIFGLESEAWNDFICSAEYKQYFFDVSE